MESREGGGPREPGGGCGQGFSPPLPSPAGLRPRLPRRALFSNPGGVQSEPRSYGREAGPPPVRAVPAGLDAVLTAASRSDAAAAAGATLPRPPGRGRGADPQRHLGRCFLLPRLLASLHLSWSSFLPVSQAATSAQPSGLLLTAFLSPHICTRLPLCDPALFSQLHPFSGPTLLPQFCPFLSSTFLPGGLVRPPSHLILIQLKCPL